MDIYIKATTGVLIALILFIILEKQNKDISLLLTILVCCMISIAAIEFIEPIFNLISRLQELGNLDENALSIVLRATGVGLVAEISSSVCKDAGNGSLAKTLQFMASCVMLWLAIPLFTNLISLFEKILATI